MLCLLGLAWSTVALASKSWPWGASLGDHADEHTHRHELSATDILTMADIRTRTIPGSADGECLDGAYVFGSPVVTQLYLLNVALRASGLTCLEGDIAISSPQKYENMSYLVTLKGSLKIVCADCLPETPFPKLEEIIFTTTQDTPVAFYTSIYSSVYTPLGISGLVDTSLTFPRLRSITLSSAQRLPTNIYFTGLLLLSNTNTSFSFPSLYKIVSKASLEDENDYLRGISWRFLESVTVSMPKFQKLEVKDFALPSGGVSTASDVFGWYMSDNVVVDGFSFPSFTTLTVDAVGYFMTAGIFMQTLTNHGTVDFDSLTTINMIAGMAFVTVKSQFEGFSANALETFSIANDNSLGAYYYNGLASGTAGSATPMTFMSVTSVSCAVRKSTCFAIYADGAGQKFNQAVFMPKLKTIRAYGDEAYGVLVYGSPTTILLLRSLESVSLSANKTVSVYAGPYPSTGSYAQDAAEEQPAL
eukprot:gb/GEZN01004659.1/.p1 GENE.gb/GEZN01004659.1/~~gb/GEZN01004659.1/.p1  ORF type:complete len:474 (-),score=43.43 gb/GEZN01004659.1/:468-1889(-)